MDFKNFFTNPAIVMAAHTLLPLLKLNHSCIYQKMGVVILTCYYIIIFEQKHFLEHVFVKNLNPGWSHKIGIATIVLHKKFQIKPIKNKMILIRDLVPN